MITGIIIGSIIFLSYLICKFNEYLEERENKKKEKNYLRIKTLYESVKSKEKKSKNNVLEDLKSKLEKEVAQETDYAECELGEGETYESAKDDLINHLKGIFDTIPEGNFSIDKKKRLVIWKRKKT